MVTDVIKPAVSRRGLMFVVLASTLWGTSGVATKAIYALSPVSPITVAAFRLALGAPVLFAALGLIARKRVVSVSRSDFAPLLLAGASLGISQACYFAAIARAGVAIATLVTICSAPVLACVFSAVLLRERLTATVAAALASALAGTVLLVGGGHGGAGPLANAMASGIALALSAALCFATFIVMGRRLANRYHPLHSIAIGVSIGAALLLAVSAIPNGVTLALPLGVWALFLYLGLVPTALAYALFFHGMQTATAAGASVAALAEPLTATVLAVLLFGEQLGALGWVGAALLIGAIAFLCWNG